MQKDPDQDPIIVSQILGKEAAIGGVIPTHQLLPWAIIIIISYFFTQGFFNLGWGLFFGVSVWLITTWWLVTGDKPHEFINKFKRPPGKEWCNGYLQYLSPIPENRPPQSRDRISDTTFRTRLKPISCRNQKGKMNTYIPFQNFSDAVCFVEISKDGYKATGILLKGGNQFQVVFPFTTPGDHPILSQSEITSKCKTREEGLIEFPPGERMTIHTGCWSHDLKEQHNLQNKADNCRLTPISIITRNKQKRIRELTEAGVRQQWTTIIFCTWTFNTDSGTRSSDWLSKIIRSLTTFTSNWINWFTGNNQVYQEQFLKTLLLKAFNGGFIPWQILLDSKFGIEAKPCSLETTWRWLWQEINGNVEPSPIPQVIRLSEIENDLILQEVVNSPKDLATVLIEGHNGRSACPEHRGSGKCVWLPGRNQKCAILTLENRPKEWSSQREQLRWLWSILSKQSVHDTKIVVELSTNTVAQYLVEDNLSKQAKQSKSASIRAAQKGAGRDVGAELAAEESFSAQKKLRKGARPIYAGVAICVYRGDEEQLNLDCQKLALSFGSVKVIRERNINYELWLETLPINLRWLLHSSSVLSERRQVFDSETAIGVIPLTIAHNIDQTGVSLISQGGKPVYIDLFHHQISRAVITGEAGSGKSCLAWEFMLDALVNNIPIVGMDTSPASGSTFKHALSLLGENAAYNEMAKTSSNLLEPPDLRQFSQQEIEDRMAQWKDSTRKILVAIAMGKIHDPKLHQRVDNFIQQALNNFLADPRIIERYNNGFVGGYTSKYWQKMPVLSDFLRFCTLQQLNIQNPEAIDRAAINQIQIQGDTLIKSPLGKTLCQPSSFSPNPIIKFFSLGGLTNEQDLYLMALNCHAACIRTALSHPVSLFVGDELAILLKKEGFAEAVGELCAIGRKNGIAVLLISQDLDSILDCSAGAQISQNLVYRITGRISSSATNTWIKRMNYPSSIIYQNASEVFVPKSSEIYSNWLVEKHNKFWQCRYYPGEMTLASIANNPQEIGARTRTLSQYPTTLYGQMQGLKHFTDEYITALKQNLPMDSIGFTSSTTELHNFNSHSLPLAS